MMNNASVYDLQGQQQVLGTLLARGGEGEVYPLVARPEILVKCYHAEILQKRGDELKNKTNAMIAQKIGFADHAVSWPGVSVFDKRKNWVGYAMRRAMGVPMTRLAHAMAYQRSFPGLDRMQIVGYLLSFLRTVRALHQSSVRVGDYNLNNILCTPGSDQITLIDCDSYQFQSGMRVYPCPVGSPDMTPREHHGQSFDKVFRTVESEVFSVAIVLFKCLMLGRHPYDVVGGEDPVSNLRQGRFAYGKGNKGIPEGAWYNIWSHLTFAIKDMFIGTFTEGATNPAQRPSLTQWIDVFDRYRNEMHKGWHDSSVRPNLPKSNVHRSSNSIG
jgi:DNA-binding helix-hairpin-helix protein with protein kinase domain